MITIVKNKKKFPVSILTGLISQLNISFSVKCFVLSLDSLSVSGGSALCASWVHFVERNQAGTREPCGCCGDHSWRRGLWWLEVGVVGFQQVEEGCAHSYHDAPSAECHGIPPRLLKEKVEIRVENKHKVSYEHTAECLLDDI